MNRFERHPRLMVAGILGVFLLLCLGALESILRFTSLGDVLVNDPWSFATLRHLELREYPPNTTFRFSPPSIRRSSGDPVSDVYLLETDEQGFIQPGRMHRDPDITIAFLGGSTTECLYVEAQERFPVLLGRALEAQLGLKINIINAARSGSNTQHMQLVLQGKILPLKPDIVVLMENVNDLGVLSRYGSYWNDDPTYRLVREESRSIGAGIRFLRDGLFGYSYRLLRHAGAQISTAFGLSSAQAQPNGGAVKNEDWARQYEASLTQFVHTAKSWGARPVLMTQVVLSSGDRRRDDGAGGNYLADALLARQGFSAQSFDDMHSYFNEIVRYVAVRHQAGLVELSRAGGWNETMLYDGLHFSTPGARRVSALAVPVLATEILRIRQEQQ
ncbi:SGNH/GDSL hydrolase family protein [Ferrovibrio sp.]|uniref:SGNH/GDSL hydrolase family protein n=1 Tax=Ferrovibrio sp. TaxID=1917215 RepID=UPI000CC3FE11|nr:SGNH/GDSL hydrolase family protein [Ferrovibrio sp.]PJI41036.1 MAG: hypothetical protein CTR53_09030 [Ferrovibrio sp.]